MLEVSRVEVIYLSEEFEVVNFLQKKYDDLGRSLEYWYNRTSLWWRENPFHSHDLPIGWGLWVGNKLVGYLGCIFTQLSYNGKLYTSLNLTSWHVEKDFRSKSIDLFLAANSFMPNALYFNTSPTTQVEKILNASKYKKYIFNRNQLMCKLVPLKLHLFKLNSIPSIIIKIVKPALFIFDKLISVYIKLFWNKRTLYVTGLEEISEIELNQFIQTVTSDQLTIARSMKFYQWLISSKENKYHVLVLKSKKFDNEIIGIAVFQTYNFKNNPILELVDFVSKESDFFSENEIIKKMISYVSENKNISSNYLAMSFTEYAGVNLEGCPGKKVFRSRNNKYVKTVYQELLFLLDTNKYFFTAQGDMYL